MFVGVNCFLSMIVVYELQTQRLTCEMKGGTNSSIGVGCKAPNFKVFHIEGPTYKNETNKVFCAESWASFTHQCFKLETSNFWIETNGLVFICIH